MPTISSCPFCQVKVAVPSGAAPADEVRCPQCQSQFSLAEALDVVLPELIVVRASSIRNLQPALVGTATEANGDAWHSDTSFGMPVYRPSGSGGFDMNATADENDLADAASSAAAAAPPVPQVDELLDEQGEEGLDEAWGSPDVAALDELSEQSAGMGIDTGAEQLDPAATSIVTKPRKKQKQANVAVEMVKTMLGGLVGLFVAYMILMWSLKNWDPLEIGRKLPAFMVPEKLEGPP